MSSSPVITVDRLSKRYVIGHQVRHDTLRDTLRHGLGGFWQRLRARRTAAATEEEFWALRDVSFTVNAGEVVGIIGRNGAGKSTLLKVLSRITEPTAGRVGLRGRVASLLEVGTGFHPELTGRENIFLNGAILGMTRAEIRQRFDEIVAFSEVEQFLDTPVKRYSSGMYVRLAFAVAAHLEPEILIVDEVLAVGDAAFQQKCLGKMRDVTRSDGRTILLVSHNMAAIQALCHRAVFLDHGRVAAVGAVADCVNAYLSHHQAGHAAQIDLTAPGIARQGDGLARLESLRILSDDGALRNSFAFNEPFRLQLGVRAQRALRDYIVGFSINALDDQVIACSNHYDSLPRVGLEAGLHVFSARVADLCLSPGSYTLTVAVSSGDQHGPHDLVRACAQITIEARHPGGEIQHPHLLDNRPGYIRPPLAWTQAPAHS